MRSFVAIFAGFLAVVVLSISTDALLHVTGVFPALGTRMSDGLFLLAIAYRTVFGIFGSWLTARLAPNRPMRHALIGGAIGMAIATLGAIVTWNQTQLGPHWYPVALIVLALPTAWAGGTLNGEKSWSSPKTND